MIEAIIKKRMSPFWIITFFYLLTRFINLTIIPIFVDEAIYTRWSQIIRDDFSQIFIPLSDGKQPLFMWIASFFLRFIPEPLFGTRAVSVLAGFGTLWVVWFLTKELFDRKSAYFASALYVLSPFSMMYDRLAVPDGLLTTFFVLTILFSIKLVKDISLKNSLFLGLIIAGGLLTKSTAGIFVLIIPFSLLLFDFIDFKSKNWKLSAVKLFGFWILSGTVGLVMYRVLKISPLYYLINQRTPDFIFSPAEVLKHPLDPFIPRVFDVTNWLISYLTLPIFLISLIGEIWLFIKNWKLALFLGAWFFGPLIIEMEIAKGFTPRYFIYIAPVASVMAAYFLKVVLARPSSVKITVLGVLLIPAVLFEFLLLTNPERAPIPEKEKTGYLEDWSSGFGVKEISQFLRQEAGSLQPITVGTEGTQGYGTLPDGLQVYLRDVPNVTVVGMGQRANIYNVPKDLINDSLSHPAYLVVNDNRFYDKENPAVHLLAKYPKGNGQDPLLLYQVKAIGINR